jgi:hypothetical protein
MENKHDIGKEQKDDKMDTTVHKHAVADPTKPQLPVTEHAPKPKPIQHEQKDKTEDKKRGNKRPH